MEEEKSGIMTDSDDLSIFEESSIEPQETMDKAMKLYAF